MLTIQNLKKAIGVTGCSVQIKTFQPIHTTTKYPQQTYDILFTHKDFPKSEFFLVIDRESGFINKEDKEWYWPMELHDLSSPNLGKFEIDISRRNLKSTTTFLDFIDAITQVHKH